MTATKMYSQAYKKTISDYHFTRLKVGENMGPQLNKFYWEIILIFCSAIIKSLTWTINSLKRNFSVSCLETLQNIAFQRCVNMWVVILAVKCKEESWDCLRKLKKFTKKNYIVKSQVRTAALIGVSLWGRDCQCLPNESNQDGEGWSWKPHLQAQAAEWTVKEAKT